MTRIAPCLYLPPSSCSAPFSFTQVSYLSLSSLLSVCSHWCTAQRSGWWEFIGYGVCVRACRAVRVSVIVCVCVCLSARVPECMHSNVTGLCNWNGNEPINDCSGVPPYPAFTSLFQLSRTHSFCLRLRVCVCECLSVSVCVCVCVCVCECARKCVFVLTILGPSVAALRAWGGGVKM